MFHSSETVSWVNQHLLKIFDTLTDNDVSRFNLNGINVSSDSISLKAIFSTQSHHGGKEDVIDRREMRLWK